MPRIYINPQDYLSHPIATQGGWVFGTQSMLGPGVLDRIIAQASAACDSFCGRRFGLPGTTTLAVAALAGDTVLALTSLNRLDGAPRLLLQIGAGATLETVQVGSQKLASWEPPYPGKVTLYPGAALAYGHLAGEPVVGYWFEQSNVQGGSTSPNDQLWDLTQEGQLAIAHAPRMGQGQMVRTVFTRAYPILNVLSIGIVYPWANQIQPGTPASLQIAYEEGWLRFPIGLPIWADSIIQTAYRGGYDDLPDDVQLAVMWEVAANLAIARNPYGAMSVGSGVRHLSWGSGKRPLLMSQEAERILHFKRDPTRGGQ